jgi:hypothetical protein
MVVSDMVGQRRAYRLQRRLGAPAHSFQKAIAIFFFPLAE